MLDLIIGTPIPPTLNPQWIISEVKRETDIASWQTQDLNTLKIPTHNSQSPTIVKLKSTPTKKDKIDAELLSYLSLQPDWDGYDGICPTKSAIEDCMGFVDLIKDSYELPTPQLSGDGEVGLYWDKEEVFIDIGFRGNGTFAFYAEAPTVESISGDSQKITTLPDKLQYILSLL